MTLTLSSVRGESSKKAGKAKRGGRRAAKRGSASGKKPVRGEDNGNDNGDDNDGNNDDDEEYSPAEYDDFYNRACKLTTAINESVKNDPALRESNTWSVTAANLKVCICNLNLNILSC